MNMNKIAETAKKRAELNKSTNTVNTSETDNQNSNFEKNEITNILSISKKVIVEFYNYACEEDRNWMKKRTKELIEEKGSRKYFAAFRSEFAKKFFPELWNKKEKQKAKSMLDVFEAIDKAS